MASDADRQRKKNIRRQKMGKFIAFIGFLLFLGGSILTAAEVWKHQLSRSDSFVARFGPAFSTLDVRGKALLNPPEFTLGRTWEKRLTALPWWGIVGIFFVAYGFVNRGKALIRAGDDFYQRESQYT